MKTTKTFLFIFFLISIFNLKGQSNFKEGYIITLSNDTIYGEIDYRGDLKMAKQCTFRKRKGAKKKYFPEELKAYRFTDSKYYVTKVIEKKKYFFQFLVEGEVNLYYLRTEIDDYFFIEKENLELREIPYVKKIVNRNGIDYQYESKNYKKILLKYMEDSPEIEKQIDNIGKPEYKPLVKLAQNYHELVCFDRDCIVYEDQRPFLGLGVEYQVGYNIDVDDEDRGTFQGDFLQHGVILRAWLPRVNEKIYFSLGYLSLVGNDEGDFDNVNYKIPLFFEYVFPEGFIKPKLAIGYNFYQSTFPTLTYAAGLNVKVAKNVSINLRGEAEFISLENVIIIPERLLLYSGNLGLEYRF